MTPMLLVLTIVLMFVALLGYETANDDTQVRLKPAGLFTWLISGNWPAKVGAGLVIVGVGALLRFALINIDVPPELKLGSGALMSGLLGLAAWSLNNNPKRRAIQLALAGSAFGVAYLTAYSAYGFFHYINDINALALLALVAIAAGVFAVTSNAMSVAILAMVGAYIAPKFAIDTPGVLAVYGYYLAASILSLVMVTLRGWRPLIHLSFLFTLAGALFFGWSGRFYQAEHYAAMQPLLLALTMVHVAMPLMERKRARSTWLTRFDMGYFIALPVVAAILTLKIAPDVHLEGALGLGGLALIWAASALFLSIMKRNEATRHALVGAALAIAAFLFYMHDLPWLLVALGLSVAVMIAGTQLGWSRGVNELACGSAFLFGLLQVIESITQAVPSTLFLNEVFAHRMIASAMMIVGGAIGMRRSVSFAKILWATGIGWAALSLIAELVRLDIDFLPQLVYGIVLGAIILTVVFGKSLTRYSALGGILIFGLIACGWWAAHDASEVTIVAYLTLTPLALLAMAWSGRDTAREDNSDFGASMAIGLLPLALLPWASAIADMTGITTALFEATVVMMGVAVAGLSARLWLRESPRWNERIQPLHYYAVTFALLTVTLFHIERGIWPIVFEVLALVYLIAYVTRTMREQTAPGVASGAVMVISVALVLQAMLLRAFGPDRVMDASDINQMHLPAVVSLMWAIFGAGLAWWGARTQSRPLWTSGAVLLVLAAIKLVVVDFGSGALGQLGNILAFIAAGLVFLGVAWVAPMPPKVTPTPTVPKQPDPEPDVPRRSAEPPSAAAPAPQSASPSTQPTRASQSRQATPTYQRVTAETPRAERKPAPTAARYQQEPDGVNWLWFVLLGLAMVIAISCAAWRKDERRRHAQEAFRQHISEAAKARQVQRITDQSTQPAAPPAAPPVILGSTVASRSVEQSVQAAAGAVIQPVAAAPVKVSDACANFVDQLPSDYVLYAAGSYQGRKMNNAENRSGHETGQFDVYVNAPGKNVVLALGAYEPSVWHITASSSTTVAGVLVSGYHTQTAAGLPGNIPLLNASYESHSPCGFFFLTRENANSADASIRKIFGRSAQSHTLAMDGRIDLGGVMQSGVSGKATRSTTIERYVDENGHVGYRQVVEN